MTPDHGLRRSGATLILAGTIGLGAMSCAELSQLNPGELRLETVPTASHLVSDGNALLRIEPLFGRALPEVSVSVRIQGCPRSSARAVAWETVISTGLFEGE